MFNYARSSQLITSLLSQQPWTGKWTSSQPVPLGPPSTENDAHGIEKLLLKTQVSEKFLHSEVNLIIQYNLNKIFFPSWKIGEERWMKRSPKWK